MISNFYFKKVKAIRISPKDIISSAFYTIAKIIILPFIQFTLCYENNIQKFLRSWSAFE